MSRSYATIRGSSPARAARLATLRHHAARARDRADEIAGRLRCRAPDRAPGRNLDRHERREPGSVSGFAGSALRALAASYDAIGRSQQGDSSATPKSTSARAHERADADDARARRAHDVDHLAHGEPGRHDVLDDERAIRRGRARSRGAASARRSPSRRRSLWCRVAAQLRSRAGCRRPPHSTTIVGRASRKRAAICARHRLRAVADPRECETSARTGRCDAPSSSRKCPCSSAPRRASASGRSSGRAHARTLISSRIAFAAATGSAASTIGRPTTM